MVRRTRLASVLVAGLGTIAVLVPADSRAADVPPLRPTSPLAVRAYSDGGADGLTHALAAGPDGNIWFTKKNAIGRMTPGGQVTLFTSGLTQRFDELSGGAGSIVAGPDGNLWFTESGRGDGRIGRITRNGVISEFAAGARYGQPQWSAYGGRAENWITNGHPNSITAGPDGNVWFSAASSSTPYGGGAFAGPVGRVTPSGDITVFMVAGAPGGGLAAGPDGSIWFVDELNAPQIGRFDPVDEPEEVPPRIPTRVRTTAGLVAGEGGTMWFGDRGYHEELVVGRVDAAGAVSVIATGVIRPTGNQPVTTLAQLTRGRDGAMWFVVSNTNVVGHVTSAGAVTLFTTPVKAGIGIATGADGSIWYATLDGRIAAFDPRSVRTPPSQPQRQGPLPSPNRRVVCRAAVDFGRFPKSYVITRLYRNRAGCGPPASFKGHSYNALRIQRPADGVVICIGRGAGDGYVHHVPAGFIVTHIYGSFGGCGRWVFPSTKNAYKIERPYPKAVVCTTPGTQNTVPSNYVITRKYKYYSACANFARPEPYLGWDAVQIEPVAKTPR